MRITVLACLLAVAAGVLTLQISMRTRGPERGTARGVVAPPRDADPSAGGAPIETPEPVAGAGVALAMVARPAPAAKTHTSLEEFWAHNRKIHERLPHMVLDDTAKLDYFCPADFNKDDVVDHSDLVMFLEAWSGGDELLDGWCDVNADGVIDELDAVEFLRVFNSGGCDPAERRSYRALIC